MAHRIKKHLKVGNGPAVDEGSLTIRMHPEDLPRGIKWGRYIHLRVKNAKLTCKVRNNEMVEVPQPRLHQININNELMDFLGLKSGTIYDFYITKALSWMAPLYVLRYHPNQTTRRKMLLKIFGVVTVITAIAVGLAYYFSG
ncbi:MAG: hypothetical protein JSV02_07205 [Dehalococcoidia bacterium]|nr:MAG: hypothetical protein JSV02_07205 [Dehalococcoidia bacterium]